MKQKDIALILVIVFLSGFFSFFISSYLIVPSSDRTAQVEVVEPIVADFVEPDKKYFNEKSINPTQTIEIGESNNKQPFDSDSN